MNQIDHNLNEKRPTNTIWWMTFCVATTFVTLHSASAQPTISSRYYCVDEVGGGIFYDSDLNLFRSASFRASEKFIVGLTRNVPAETGARRYDVKITGAGKDYAQPCLNHAVGGVPFVSTGGVLRCDSALRNYVFDFSTNRYLKLYSYGYIDGAENNDNTPSIFGGVCTPID